MPGFLSGLESEMGGKSGDTLGKLFKKKKASVGDDDSSGEGFYGSDVTSYHKGGTVRKTGLARLRKGERVLTKKQFKRLKGK